MPWLVGMTYEAVRTDRYEYIHWVSKNRDHELDELHDLDTDPFELRNLIRSRSHAGVGEQLRRELARLVVEALGIEEGCWATLVHIQPPATIDR
jgi:hypothetical protein